MILKASQRGGGQDLAAHLLRTDDNEHVRIHELRGFAADDLHGAFKESEAVSRGTKCRQYLFSLSLSPPENEQVSDEEFELTVDRIEHRLGLENQPRAIVIHEKEGRRHAHCVWSRIDADTMTARQMSFYKQKLAGMSRDLYLEHGWKMPDGLAQGGTRDPRNFTLAEWQQAKRQGIDPRWLKASIQECWTNSDNGKAFGKALEERGCFLAKGDRRDFVVVDHTGEVWSLPRLLSLKTKEVRGRLGDGQDLQSVEETKQAIGDRMTPALKRHIHESRGRFAERSQHLDKRREKMTQAHRQARVDLRDRQQQQWQAETRQRAHRLPKGMRGLWHRLTSKYQEIRAANQAEAEASRERQWEERRKLFNDQLEKRSELQDEIKQVRKRQAEELKELREDVGRYLRFKRERGEGRTRGMEVGLKLQR